MPLSLEEKVRLLSMVDVFESLLRDKRPAWTAECVSVLARSTFSELIAPGSASNG